jgi:hypothetical protein
MCLHFFLEYLFILENEVMQFQNFQHMSNNHPKYTFCCVFVIKPNGVGEYTNFHKLGVPFSTISANINKNFPFFWLNLLQVIFVPNISHGYVIQNY